MTEKTGIKRMDYGQLPPGYRAPEGIDVDSMPALLEHAWAHFKTKQDPPGVLVTQRLDDSTWSAWVPMQYVPQRFMRLAHRVPEAEARAVAWAWHDRRLALWQRLAEAELVMRTFIVDDLWPRILTWTDDEVAEVEHWLRDSTAELPAVLE